MGLLSVVEGPRSRRLAGLLAVALAAVLFAGALGGCGDDDSEVPEGSVAVVGQEEITRAELEQRLKTLRRQAGSTLQPAPGAADEVGSTAQAADVDAMLEQQALSSLLQAAAIEQEAGDRGIAVSDAEVRQRWEAATAEQFRTAKAKRGFLGGQTEQELLDQLRLQLLNERLLADVSDEAGGGKAGRSAVRKFQQEFQKRWSEKTSCGNAQQASSLCPEP